jgi:hypothetical protein
MGNLKSGSILEKLYHGLPEPSNNFFTLSVIFSLPVPPFGNAN